ncbi:MAG TPA: hypothetical protein VFB80_19475 [Pirellulaceae bacterium]|nr:hypothetical protein [Pirellulaceae bacterium]
MATAKINTDAGIWQRVLEFDSPPSPAAASALLKLQFPEDDRRRMKQLTAKARAGQLSRAEKSEAEAYERLGCLLDILHSQARRVLKQRRTAS